MYYDVLTYHPTAEKLDSWKLNLLLRSFSNHFPSKIKEAAVEFTYAPVADDGPHPKEIEIFSTQTWWVLWMLREFCRKNAWKYVELYIIFFTLFAKLLQKVSYRFKKKQELQLHHLIASKNHLIASKNHLIASKNHLIASKNYLIASKNRLIASKNHLIAPKNHVIAPKSYLIASKNYLIASKNHYSLKKPPYSLKKPPYSLKKPPYSLKKLPYSLKKPPYSLKKPPHSFKKPPHSLKKPTHSLKKPPYSLKKPPDSLKNHFFFWFFSRVWYRDLFDAGGTGFDLSGLRTLRILRITRLVSWSRSFFVFVRIFGTPWTINMEPKNHPFGKENDLPNLHDYVPC